MLKQFVLLSLLAALASPVMAHTGVGATHDVIAGFSHPWQGLDHLLVMLAIGLCASLQQGAMRWLLPLGFLSWMAAGAALGFLGFTLPYAEWGVAASVLVLGMTLTLNWRPRVSSAALLLIPFAVFHGFVHAAEALTGSEPLTYGLGFLCATALLHALGFSMGFLGKTTVTVLRISLGIVASISGLLLLAH